MRGRLGESGSGSGIEHERFSDLSPAFPALSTQATTRKTATGSVSWERSGTARVQLDPLWAPRLTTTLPTSGVTGGASACVVCPAGRIAAADGSTSCEACDFGKTATVGSTACSACDPGTYAEAKATTECKQCDAGKASAASGAIGCDPCSAGTASSAGATTCDSCASGKVSSAGAAACSACGTGSFPNAERSSCEACAAGTEADGDGCRRCAPGSANANAGQTCVAW